MPESEVSKCPKLKYQNAPSWSIKMPQTEVSKCPKLKYLNAPNWSIKMPQMSYQKFPKLNYQNAPSWSIKKPQTKVSKMPQAEVSKCPKLKYQNDPIWSQKSRRLKYQKPSKNFWLKPALLSRHLLSRPVLMICQHIDQKTPMFDIKKSFRLSEIPLFTSNQSGLILRMYLPL